MPAPRSLPPPQKKRKVQSSSVVSNIKQLEDELTHAVTANASLNPLVDLLELTITAEDAQDTSKGIYALYRVFVVIMTHNKLGSTTENDDDAAKTVKAWLWERYNTFVDFLGGLLKDDEKILRTSALQIMFSLEKHISTAFSKSPSSSVSQPQFHISHFRRIVSALLLCPPSSRPHTQNSTSQDNLIHSSVLSQFYETWFSVYDDIRWFFLRESGTLLIKNPTHPTVAQNLLSILERLSTFPTEQAELNAWWVSEMGSKPPKPKRIAADDVESDREEERKDIQSEDDDWRKFFEDEPAPSTKKAPMQGARLHSMTIHQSLHSLSSHRAVFTRTWLALLPRLAVEETGSKVGEKRRIMEMESAKALAMRALTVMHRGVLPHLTRAVLVMDWVGACIDFGGSVGLLALNALFVLMKDYNLDYPSFYTRLYAFLDRDVLHSKHRARFFRMTELFLSSTHLPATLIASFVKRLARLSLSAPPAAIVILIPFTYNALKQHPALMAMIHREQVDGVDTDPFLPSMTDPLHTHAIDSSLWELLSHRTHYHASVSTLCKIFTEAFTKPHYAMEDFLDHTYATLFDTEVNRKIKREPALAMDMEVVKSKKLMLFPVGVVNGSENQAEVDEASDNEAVQVSYPRDLVNDLWTFA